MTKRSRTIVIIIVALLVILFAFRIGQGIYAKKKDKSAPVAVKQELVETAAVELGTLAETLSLTGNILPDKQVTLFSEVPGIVDKILVKESDTVKKGELIARIANDKFSLNLDQAAAALEAAKVNTDSQAKEYARTKDLYASRAVSQQKMDLMEAGYKASKAQLTQAQAMYRLAKKTLSDCEIYAPFSGVIAKKYTDEGEVTVAASAMKNAPIVTVVAIDKVKIAVNVPEKSFARLKAGIPALVTVDAYPGQEFKGAVSLVGSIIDPQSRTVNAEVLLDNPQLLLRPGMYARVQIVLDTKQNVPFIQFDTIMQDLKGPYVFMLQGSQAKKTYITTGVLDKNRIEVLQGIRVGDRIVSFGQQRIKDGDTVIVAQGGQAK